MARPKRGSNTIPTNERILRAAESEFGKYGFERTRLEDIAEIAGIRRPSLLYHFKSKDKLYSTIVHRAFDSLRQSLVERMRKGEFREQVDNLVEALVDFVQKNPSFAPIVLREIIDGNGPAREILIHEMSPLLQVVETWLLQQGKGQIPSEVSVRHVILQIASDTLLYGAAGALQEPMWGKRITPKEMARRMLIKNDATAKSDS